MLGWIAAWPLNTLPPRSHPKFQSKTEHNLIPACLSLSPKVPNTAVILIRSEGIRMLLMGSGKRQENQPSRGLILQILTSWAWRNSKHTFTKLVNQTMFVEIPKNKCGVRKNCSCDTDSDSRTLSGINGSLQRPSRQMKGSTKVKKVSRTILDEGKLSNWTADSENSFIFF